MMWCDTVLTLLSNFVVFELCSRGELCTCWYILLSGSVFIDGSMYLPGAR